MISFHVAREQIIVRKTFYSIRLQVGGKNDGKMCKSVSDYVCTSISAMHVFLNGNDYKSVDVIKVIDN